MKISTLLISVAVSLLCDTSLAVDTQWSSTTTTTYKTATFVQPAKPPIATTSPAPTDIWAARNKAINNGYGLYNNKKAMMVSPSTTPLFAKKKGGGGGAAAARKVQVKLLKHIKGTGQAGDVIQVTPAFFNNKLRPTKSAVMISDEEVAKEKEENDAMQTEAIAKANEIKASIEDEYMKVTITRKAGPNGQLFGGIGPKVIVEEMKQQICIDEDCGTVKITALKDGESGKKMRGDIKHVGTYTAVIALAKDISANLAIHVEAAS